MANNGGPVTTQAGVTTSPRPVQAGGHQEGQRGDLTRWWRNFTRGDKRPAEQPVPPQGIFGVPLQTSIRYANVAISLYDDKGESYIYGYVPIVVAKCGVYLKEKATDVEGIFRLAGSEKRIKELKVAFDSPDRYGKGLDWSGYTVHDAANILRRYINMLPEPIIPLEFYERFREPLRNHQMQAVTSWDEAQSPSVGDFDHNAAIKVYQGLITELPPLNRQLLLYILDLLAVFASKSDINKMPTRNLSAIFQPGVISHPQHDMAPKEYILSQDVLTFLIENQDSFLIGMQGTAADADTVRDVQSGTPAQQPNTPTTPTRAKTVVSRNGSNASAAAESVRKWGSVRRNVSVSSRHSKQSEGGPVPVGIGVGSPTTPTSGVHRSNTLPSRRTGSAAPSPRFSRDKTSDPPTPNPGALVVTDSAQAGAPRQSSIQSTPVAATGPGLPPILSPEIQSPSSSEATTPMATVGSDTTSTNRSDYVTPKKDTTPLLAPPGANSDGNAERSPSNAISASSGRGWRDILKQSPTSDSEGRRPNKLQKKRLPGSTLSSAQSSSQSLEGDGQVQRSPLAQNFPASATEASAVEQAAEKSGYATAESMPVQSTPQRNPTDATLRPTTSPTHSFRSTDLSDTEMVGDDMPPAPAEPEKEKKRRRWRFSRSQNKLDQPQTPANNTLPGTTSSMSHPHPATSQSTVGSSVGAPPRRSFQEPTPLGTAIADGAAGPAAPAQSMATSNTDPLFSDSEREKKGLMPWIRGKIQERKDKEAERRAKTPERTRDRDESKQDLRLPPEAIPVRNKSLEASSAMTANASGVPGAGAGGQVPTNASVPPTSTAAVPATVPAIAPAPAPTASGSNSLPPSTSAPASEERKEQQAAQ